MSRTAMETSACGLLRALARSRATGVLVARHERLELSIAIERGVPATASSNDAEDRLHGVLLRDDYVSVVDLEEAVKCMLRERTRLGSVLLREGSLYRKQLKRALRTQYERIVYRVLTTPGLDCEFQAGPPVEEDVVLHGSINEWIRRALFQVEEYRRVFDAIGGMSSIFVKTSAFRSEISEAGFDADTLRELCSMGTQMTAKLFCSTFTLRDFDVLRLIWILLEINAIERAE